MPKPRVRSYFEPWIPARSRVATVCPFPNGIPPEANEESAQRLIDQCAAEDKQAEWLVWGSGVVESGLCVSLEGQTTVASDRWPLASFGRVPGEKPTMTPGDLARRAAACVNACRAMPDPEGTLDRVRDLLRDVLTGAADAADNRFVSLLARMVPAEEIEAFAECGEED